jgi:tetratricopeptide (TPR) repeat protein
VVAQRGDRCAPLDEHALYRAGLIAKRSPVGARRVPIVAPDSRLTAKRRLNAAMKHLRLFAALLLLLLTTPAALQAQAVTLPQPSPKASVSQTIGVTEVAVVYHRPSVNQREIWGKLVPFGYTYQNFGTSRHAPWRAGANETTRITFQHDVTVAGKPLKAGTYGVMMAITPDGKVTAIFSHDTALWGSFYYDEKRDAQRADVKWEDAPFREQLTYEFTDVTEESAVLSLVWEKKRIPLPLKVDTVANVIATLKDDLRSSKGFQYQSFLAASNYLVTKNRELPLALEWAEFAVSDRFVGQRNYATLSNKGLVLEKMGRTEEAKPVMDEALKLGTALQVHLYGRQLIAAGKPARALEVFKQNAERHPNTWPVSYGLARGYSAMGDYKAALEALLQAQKELPPDDKVNATAIATNIEKLKRGENIN